MTDCSDFRELMQDLLAGEISPADLEALHRHCQSCPECRQLMEVHSDLARTGREIPEPREDDFAAMRRNVLKRIDENSPDWASKRRWWDLGALLRAQPAAFLPIAAVLVIVAVYAGRWSVGVPEFNDEVMMREINQQANRQAGLIDYWDSPYSYSNVSARPTENGKLDLSFEVSRHVRLETPMDSPIAKEVLLHAILEPGAIGSRMNAMALTEQILDPTLREALVFTLHNDPHLAVRVEAMSILGRYPYDKTIQDALLMTLRTDNEVQMRLLALEYLAGKQVNKEDLRQYIEEPWMENDPAVLQYATELIDN